MPQKPADIPWWRLSIEETISIPGWRAVICSRGLWNKALEVRCWETCTWKHILKASLTVAKATVAMIICWFILFHGLQFSLLDWGWLSFSYSDNTHSSVTFIASDTARLETGSSFSMTRALQSHMQGAWGNFTPEICEWGERLRGTEELHSSGNDKLLRKLSALKV